MISNLLEYDKKKANEKQLIRKKPTKPLNKIKIKKISTFLTSVIVSLAQKKVKIWLPTILSSLCRKPRLLSSLHQVLQSVNVVAHTDRHERRLENIRMSAADPTLRLKKNNKIWNVCVIDNIDFKEKSFTFGNIYDTTRATTHATIRIVFQFELPNSIESISDSTIQLNEQTYLFGPNQFANETLIGFSLLINQLLNCKQTENNSIEYSCEFDSDIVNSKIIEQINIGIQCLPPHIVILEAGGNPSSDEEIFAACEKYIEDLELVENQPVEICCDEAIFRRVIKLHQKNSRIRPLLGQWHTSKDMCNALLTIFSSYGIYNLAATLGVKFLDKLESVVDYRSTCRVLDLIWVAITCAIHIHITKKQIEISQIEEGNNDLLKVWYCFYKWCGWWKAHRAGIRTGNTNTQLKCLAAFSPLFPAGGKLNYTKSTVYFLALLVKYPRSKELLHYAGSINLTREGHYYAFDEALETFGVKFIKQNITGNVINEENLKRQIKAAQTERERINLLFSEFIEDNVMSHSKHSVDNRHVVLWNLIKTLEEAFGSVNPLEHSLFKNSSQLDREGCQKLFKCYNAGLERLKTIYRQEILQAEPINTKGRKAKEIVVSKVKDIKKAEKEADKTEKKQKIASKLSEKRSLVFTQQESNNSILPENLSSSLEGSQSISDQIITNIEHVSEPSSKKQKTARHLTTQQEKDLLATLMTPNSPTEEEVEEVLKGLLQFWDGWTKKKVRDYWSHHKPKS
ncbi:hypothetical protein RhiirC2_826194 [Rhizophagus irregularis]|uniref:Uncharacterized protein n=3 Tax=Rhizophagus irregularis TaxID=588596 RepID=A0A2N1M6Q1_9GLOM|nr:hypothetical protein RhiirC2_826194 [Rhizophagus irregularis]